MKYIKQFASFLIVLLAIWGMFSIYKSIAIQKSKEEVTSVVILNRVEKVFKLVTVEGNFSELYDYKNHYFADLWPFRKKALVRVKARVLVGYNFEDIKIDVDEISKTITINGPVHPEILSIEHDLDYYNFENGLFNMITNSDITKMSARAKEFIIEKALDSDLFDQAEEQKKELLEILDLYLSASGWILKVEERSLLN